MVNKKQFKPKLESLVKLFESNLNFYKSKDYKEDHLRQEFLNPFFKALGWDMDNEQHFAPQYREVIHEDRIEIEGKPKAPDYSFRIGNERKFFVEAKAAFVNVEKEIAPSFQLRRYSWSGKLPVSILSDFEEFSIYDTTIEPKVSDKADIARIKYLQFQNYPDEIGYLWDTFSKEAVWSGSFDKFAKKERRGNELVDKAFLKEIEQWRNLLAKDIAVDNPRIDIFHLNEAVQKIIDRIIFLRIAEDRGIEGYETLKEIIKYQNSYPYLVKLFYKAQEKYNSNLFDFNADTVTPKLKISDRILDRIIDTLYFPKSPYEFSVIGVEILGSVYEQFLGKVIRLTKGHNAIIEEKPEVKKAGGVYYTPKYIVDYIIKNTVGELVKRKTPKDVSKLRIVDPACGSGSFLLGAYTFLLDWHLKYYTNNDPSKYVKSKALFKDNEGNYLLSTAEKKRILINNIYGVDIDAQAVEVSKLSLALKMLENENSETINAQLRLFAERILPDLSTNIKCGNSLIGSDYYDGKDISTISDEEIRKINAFDWEKEFVDVFKQGGFDAVIGNPPYIKEYTLKDAFEFKDGKLSKYYQGKMDLWYAFVCFGIDIIKNKIGLLSFIAPNNWITNAGASILREKILSDAKIVKYVDFNEYNVFDTASIQTMIFVLQKDSTGNSFDFRYTKLDQKKINIHIIDGVLNNRRSEIKYRSFKTRLNRTQTKSSINFINSEIETILNRISANGSTRLSDDSVGTGIDVHQDFVTENHIKILGNNYHKGEGIFVINESQLTTIKPNTLETSEILKPFYTSDELDKYYSIKTNKKWVIYTDKKRKENIKKYPNIKRHLDRFAKVITSDFKPYGLHRARDEKFFIGEKIMSLRKTMNGEFTYTDYPCYVSQSYFVIKPEDINLGSCEE